MISNTTFVIQYNLLSNGWLKTLHFRAFMATVEKLQLMGIVLAGWCTDTQSNSFIHFAKRCTVSICLYLFQISNVLRHNSFFGCCNLVLSWCHGRKKTKELFIISIVIKIISIIVSRFGLLVEGLCSSSQQQLLVFSRFLSKVRY